MDKVDAVPFLHIAQKRMAAFLNERVPAHLRDLQFRRNGTLHRDHAAAQKAEAVMLAEFIALVKEQLHSEADPEKRLAAFGFRQHRPVQAGGTQLVDGIPEGADARQNDTVRPANLLRIGRHACFQSKAQQRAAQGEEVSHPVIHDRDHPSTPLVLGTRSAFFSSMDTAVLSARAKALKQPSMMWCELLPAS